MSLVVMGTPPVIAQDAAWTPPPPSETGDDWLKLTSGEWLRGEILLFRDEVLTFDSSELDELEIDWGDISEIRSPRPQTLTFLKKGVVTGTVAMKDGVIKVDTGSGVREYQRGYLMSIISGKPREINFWSIKATLGMIIRSGNSEQTDFNTIVLIRREATRSRFDIDYRGNLGSVQGIQNVNNHRANANFNYFVSRQIFLTPGSVEYFSDEFQNTDYRVTFNVGAGYYFWRTSRFDWYLSLGAGYQTTRYISVQPGVDETDSSVSVIPGTSVEWDITSDAELHFNYSAQIGVQDPRNSFHNAFALLSIDFWSFIDLDLSVEWDHVQNPKEDADGNTPERNDLQISFGFGVDL